MAAKTICDHCRVLNRYSFSQVPDYYNPIWLNARFNNHFRDAVLAWRIAIHLTLQMKQR